MSFQVNINSQIAVYADFASFPATGLVKTIYIAKDTNTAYYWNDTTLSFEQLGGATSGAVWGAITGNISDQTDLINLLNAKVPYTGATGNVDLGEHDLYVNEVFLYDAVNNNHGSIHYTDGDFHVEDADGHKLLVVEDGFMQLHKTDTIQSNLYTSGLSATRDHYLPDESGTIALTSDLDAKQDTLVSGTNIKTIEGQSLLGAGNINLTATDVGLGNVDNTSDLNKPVSTATQTALNAKQNTLTLTTTGTSGAATLVGANLNIPQYSGGGGFQGVHALLPLASGQSTYAGTTSQGLAGVSPLANRLFATPFIPNQNITTSALYMNVVSTGGAGNARILIYSNLNGLPDQKLYESADLNCSTTGLKTATTTFNFVAGTTYWLCIYISVSFSISHINSSGAFPLNIVGVGNPMTHVYVNATYGSAPTTFGTPTYGSGNPIFVGITKA